MPNLSRSTGVPPAPNLRKFDEPSDVLYSVSALCNAVLVLDRYLVISADGHAGADLLDYKPYLASKWHDEFDAWAAAYVNPFNDLVSPDADRSWNSERRLRETSADGIVAEVLFPNTVPPFFPSSNLTAPAPTAAEYERRWAGLQAHNRWLADFCAATPGRRAGIAQILLNDVDDAVREIHWTKEAGLMGGILLPGVAPGSGLPGLWDACYEPIWNACAEADVTINHHSGAGLPELGYEGAARAVMLIEIPQFSHRGLWHLIFSGVFERHPALRFVLTEQGTGWIPGALRSLDWFYRRMDLEGSAENLFGGDVVAQLSMLPSEYFARNCYVGASFLRPVECELRYEVGIDRIMWGSDYPHSEGSYPYSREALRATFAHVDETELRIMLGETAAKVYGFDLDLLGPLAAELGPTVDEVAKPLESYPADSTCNAFDEFAIIRAW
ncbi:MAG: amidohydrolase [Actinobacteria bacterium]|nr:amidohydrolase [Actinomycetota bacterium]